MEHHSASTTSNAALAVASGEATPQRAQLQPRAEASAPFCATLDVRVLLTILDALPGPAIVLTHEGRVLLANSMGWEAERRSPSGELRRIASDCFEGKRTDFTICPLPMSASTSTCYLLWRVPRTVAAPELMEVAAQRWGLTRRQQEAFSCLVRGMCNKEIATALNCALRTVELHVSAILRATGASSRAQAIAQFWTMAS